MITYKEIENANIAVYLDKKRAGTIKKVAGGFQYFPKGGKNGGDVLLTLQAVKASLEAE